MKNITDPSIEVAEEMTEKELDVVTTVFRNYETGLREATILPKDLHAAMKMLGLNPMEQEIIDLSNNIVKNGLIYFPEFCKIIHEKYRQDDEELFRQNMFKILCGTEPFPEKFKAKKYKLHDHFITKKNFFHMMSNLPEEVSEEDIEEMFTYADKDCDGKISYLEFQVMINPPKPPPETQIHRQISVKRVTIQSTEPETLSVTNFINAENAHEHFINNEKNQKQYINVESNHDDFINTENSHMHLLDY